MDMEWDSVANPTSDKILPTEALAKAIPEVEWTKGKAGVEVAPEVAEDGILTGYQGVRLLYYDWHSQTMITNQPFASSFCHTA